MSRKGKGVGAAQRFTPIAFASAVGARLDVLQCGVSMVGIHAPAPSVLKAIAFPDNFYRLLPRGKIT
jgi:hypothetical protein